MRRYYCPITRWKISMRLRRYYCSITRWKISTKLTYYRLFILSLNLDPLIPELIYINIIEFQNFHSLLYLINWRFDSNQLTIWYFVSSFLSFDQAIISEEAVIKPRTCSSPFPASTIENPDPHDLVSPDDDPWQSVSWFTIQCLAFFSSSQLFLLIKQSHRIDHDGKPCTSLSTLKTTKSLNLDNSWALVTPLLHSLTNSSSLFPSLK